MSIFDCEICGEKWCKEHPPSGCAATNREATGSKVVRSVDVADLLTPEQREEVDRIRQLISDGRDEVIALWEKAKEESRACGVCGGVNWFRAGVAFDAALGLGSEGTVTG